MAEAALLTSLGWVASPSIKMLFEKAHRLLGTSVKKRKKKLEASVLPTLSLAIEKEEKRPNKEKLVDWLRRLKDAYYEAEDAIDLLEYEKLEQQVKDARKTLNQKAENEKGTPISLPLKSVAQSINSASDKLKSGLSVFSTQKMLKRCIDNLIEIADEARVFCDLLGGPENANGSDADRETDSEPPIKVFGREKDKENIVGILTKKPINFECGPSTRPATPIIAITGRSGAGKTTLAQVVYKHMDEHDHFDLCVWVYVPREFKATDVIKNMIEIINQKENVSNDYPSTSLEALLTKIRKMLVSKKLLLVLDDFWSDTEDFVEQWGKFIGCFNSCLPGSRILLTTQLKNTPQKVGIAGVTEVETYNIEEIEEGPFLDLFMHYAWPNNSHLQKDEFEKIGKKIAFKLRGDPGTAKLVGRQLSGKLDLRHWEETAEKDWLGDNMKWRIWSYQQLSPDLQRCFAICSLLPKGNHTTGRIIIHLWMAEGFIRTKDNESLEDIGEKYLQVLVSKFFLEQIEEKEGCYQLHDLLRDLAERVQGDDLIRIDYSGKIPSQLDPMLCISENVRHISFPSSMINQLPKKLCFMKNIRTFLVRNDGGFVEVKVLEEILKHMKKLRVLQLPECCDELSKSIGNLKHLRCLYFRYDSGPLKKLPNSICKLYHLKILALPKNCESLPKKFSELISLRHLLTSRETISHISLVGRLTSLQSLHVFVARKKRGHELHQLENLNQLRGRICITGLEKVGSTVDAVKANMQNKKHLEKVKFEWKSHEGDTDVTGLSTRHVQLLDALKPHSNISALTLKGFGGDKLPSWILNQNSLKRLTSLTLMNCDNVEKISSIDKSLPNCRILKLWGLKNLKEIPSLPPNLTYLVIHHLPQITYFSVDDLLMKEERKQSKLEGAKQIAVCWPKFARKFESILRPCLLFVKERLEVGPESCNSGSQYRNSFSEIVKFDPDNDDYSEDQLLGAWVMYMYCYIETMFNKNEESKLVLPSSLTYLKISSCSITSDALSTSIQCLVSLSKLELSNIQTLTSLPPKEVLCSLKNLKSLTIEKCFLLSSLGGIGAVTSLKVLELDCCFNLNPSNELLPSSLETLELLSCSNVDVTCALDVGSLSHLKVLNICGWAGRLEGLNSLNALQSLSVLGCPGINPSSPMDKYTFELHQAIIDNLFLLKLMLSNESISSIKHMAIYNFNGDSSDDEVFQSLTSLMQLSFGHCNATHLPKNLKNLASVSYMEIKNCPILCELELEELPRNLIWLEIEDCPTLTEKVNKGGPYQVQCFQGRTTLTFPIVEGKETFLGFIEMGTLDPNYMTTMKDEEMNVSSTASASASANHHNNKTNLDAGAHFVLQPKGSWIHCGYHMTTAIVASALLSLPFAFASLGWAGGVVCLVLGAAVSFYCYFSNRRRRK